MWNAGGHTELEVRDLADGALRARGPAAPPVLPGWSLAGDGRTLLAELTGRPRRGRCGWSPLDGDGPVALPSTPPPRPTRTCSSTPSAAATRPPTAAELDGWLYIPPGVHGAQPHGGQLPRRPGGAGTARLLPGGPGAGGGRADGVRAQRARLRRVRRGVHGRRRRSARESSFDDVRTTVEHLVGAGIALPGQLGAHGWSYGGYLTLVALTRWPDLFAAGATLAGMSDLRTFFAGTEPWMAAASVTEYGDPVADRDMLAAISPMTTCTG